MKIKRFEATSMPDALRMIKKEFGEDAVILSAKNLRKTGKILGGKAGRVVVTAAVDRSFSDSSVREAAEAGQPVHEERQTHPSPQNAKSTEGIGRILQHFTPITRTGRKKMQPKIFKLMNETTDDSGSADTMTLDKSLFDRLVQQGIDSSLATVLAEQADELMPDTGSCEDDVDQVLTQLIDARGWVAPRTIQNAGRPAVMVLVGPGGAGKTTTAVKLAAQEVLHGSQTVGLISLDNQRVAGTGELQRYADLIQVPFAKVTDADQFSAALQTMDGLDLVIVDTPALGPADLELRNHLRDMLDMAGSATVHLLLNGAACAEAMDRTMTFFKPLGVTHILPTHLDWFGCWGTLVNRIDAHRLSISVYSNGSRVPEDMVALSGRKLAGILLDRDESRQADPDVSFTFIKRGRPQPDKDQYVANRNSDIFHMSTCKSVSRINDDNILIFRDSDEAIEQGFKPCRMCCVSLFVPKPIDRSAHRRYAGSRT